MFDVLLLILNIVCGVLEYQMFFEGGHQGIVNLILALLNTVATVVIVSRLIKDGE